MHICVCLCICLGLQRVYHPRDEPAAGAVAHAARFSPRDRAHGGHHPPQVQCHSDTAQAEHLRGRHDPALTLPRRQVRAAARPERDTDSNAIVIGPVCESVSGLRVYTACLVVDLSVCSNACTCVQSATSINLA